MTMKTFFIFALQWLAFGAWAQTTISKSVPVGTGQKVLMKFDYPELIKVGTWDKNEISIQTQVDINNGENDDAFEWLVNNDGPVIEIESNIRGLKNLPQMVTVRDGAEKILFASREEYRKYKAENGRSFDRVSWGVDINVTIEVKVPKGMETEIISTYGMVEVRGFTGPLKVEARYGGVDAALNEKSVGELSAEVHYGQIYSNLDVRLSGDGFQEKAFYTFVSAKPGSGPRYGFASKYGNVYLRKLD